MSVNGSSGTTKKTLIVGLLRTAFLVMAYQHVMIPKQGALPAGTQRTLWISVKNAWKMARLRWWAAKTRALED
jgi:hypothetical protein